MIFIILTVVIFDAVLAAVFSTVFVYKKRIDILVATFLISIFYGEILKDTNLYKEIEYSEALLKIIFSVIAGTFCVSFAILGYCYGGDTYSRDLTDRNIMWVINILGTWFGIGFNCTGPKERAARKELIRDNRGRFTNYRKDLVSITLFSVILLSVIIFSVSDNLYLCNIASFISVKHIIILSVTLLIAMLIRKRG